MQTLMLRLDAVVRRRRAVVLVAWAVLLVAALPLAARQSEDLSGGGFAVPGSQSEAVEKALREEFPNAGRAQLAAVLVPGDGARPEQVRAAIDRVANAARRTPDVELTAAARERALAAAGESGPPRAERGRSPATDGALMVPLAPTVSEDGAIDVARDLRERLDIADGARDGVATHLVGQGALWAGLTDLSQEDLASAEMIGFPIVALVLLFVFGSLAAAALPLGLGAMSVAVTGGLIYLLSQTMDMSVFVTNMASMIGIGVAVDYSLFVLARYREEVRAGRSPEDARAAAMATSGLAVLFSGLTVIVSLAGLWMIDNQALRSMALGAILVVAVSVLGSATLLPALIRLLGHRVYTRSRVSTVTELVVRSWRRPRRGSTREGAARDGFWHRWTVAVTRRPGLAALASAAALLVLAVPTLDIEIGTGALRQFPEGHETRAGFEAAAAVAGPGASAPVQVVADTGAAERVRRTLAADAAVERVGEPIVSRNGRKALLTAIPRGDGESPATIALVERLRERLPPSARVGGATAGTVDSQDQISGAMWKILLFVLGLSYVVLLVLLRSVVLPLKAVLMNLLSVGASYGVLVAVFQWGWLDGVLGFQSTGHLETLTPPLVLAVVFGLSMDYEVFLLSRIRERHAATGDTRRAVAEGLGASAKTITSAALIMVAVFAVFVGTGVPSIKQIGLGCAVAIAVDATLVRLVLVPAAMELLGRWNWYLPRGLQRVLPRSGFETLPVRS